MPFFNMEPLTYIFMLAFLLWGVWSTMREAWSDDDREEFTD